VVYPDRQLMLFAADVLTRVPGGTVIFDVKCSRWVAQSVKHQGGKPLMWKTGHAFIKGKLKETGAPLAGEMSGHMFFKERWYGFDDGLYAGARLLEIVSRWKDANWPLKHLPNALSTPELNIKMKEGEPHALIEKLQSGGKFPGAKLFTLDGVRAEYDDGFGLARASNTTPVVVLRFEADNEAALKRIQAEFKAALETAWPGIDAAF
jgi:phosphomannomutase/phosphoglucomutase